MVFGKKAVGVRGSAPPLAGILAFLCCFGVRFVRGSGQIGYSIEMTSDEHAVRVEFVVRLVGKVGSVTTSCECVTVGPVEPDGVVRGHVHCADVPRFVTPGLYIRDDSGHVLFIQIPCGRQ